MQEVRTITGDATAAMFALGGPQIGGTPIVVDNTAGAERLFILNSAGEVIEMAAAVPFALRVAEGLVSGTTAVYKFGRAPNGVQTTNTDIWSRADSTPTQSIWVAPTAARVHAIASDSDSDGKTGAPSSVGARTLRIWGLTAWTTAETSEDVTLDGTTGVNTANAYVIIHRMEVLTAGTTSINVGIITATAAGDSTVTAVILPNEGQTQMAIYGVPSTQKFYMTNVRGSIYDNTAQTRVIMNLVVNQTPDSSPLDVRFVVKDQVNIQNSGSSSFELVYDPPRQFAGPTIIKLRGTASASDTDFSGAFGGYLVDN